MRIYLFAGNSAATDPDSGTFFHLTLTLAARVYRAANLATADGDIGFALFIVLLLSNVAVVAAAVYAAVYLAAADRDIGVAFYIRVMSITGLWGITRLWGVRLFLAIGLFFLISALAAAKYVAGYSAIGNCNIGIACNGAIVAAAVDRTIHRTAVDCNVGISGHVTFLAAAVDVASCAAIYGYTGVALDISIFAAAVDSVPGYIGITRHGAAGSVYPIVRDITVVVCSDDRFIS